MNKKLPKSGLEGRSKGCPAKIYEGANINGIVVQLRNTVKLYKLDEDFTILSPPFTLPDFEDTLRDIEINEQHIIFVNATDIEKEDDTGVFSIHSVLRITLNKIVTVSDLIHEGLLQAIITDIKRRCF